MGEKEDDRLDREVGATYASPLSNGNLLAYLRAIYRELKKKK